MQKIECGNCGRSHEVDDEEVKKLTAVIDCSCGAKGHILRQDLNHGWFWNCPRKPEDKPGIYYVDNGKNIPLNPSHTPLCPEYTTIYIECIQLNGKSGVEAFKRLKRHRANCPVCQARKAEFDELAKNAEKSKEE